MGATLDGNSVNRRLLTLHGDSKVVYKTKNPYAGVLSCYIFILLLLIFRL